jgi:hypothetical protein
MPGPQDDDDEHAVAIATLRIANERGRSIAPFYALLRARLPSSTWRIPN